MVGVHYIIGSGSRAVPEFGYSSGISMIEVLVSVVVLSIGLLGLTSLQLNNLQNTGHSLERSQATLLTKNIIERMYANKDALASYAHQFGNEPSSSTDCLGVSASCTVVEIAEYDLNWWLCTLGKWEGDGDCPAAMTDNTILPDGDGAITVTDNRATVSIRWSEKRLEATQGNPNINYTTLTVSTEL